MPSVPLPQTTIELVARRHLRAGRIREAESLNEDWLATRPGSVAAHVLRGWLFLISGDLEHGRHLIEQGVVADPRSAFAYVARGALHEADGKLDDAELCFRHALTLDAADLDAASFLVQARRRAGDLAEAEAVARQLTSTNPGEPLGFWLLGEMLLLKKPENLDEAAQVAAQAVALDPDDWRGWLLHGRVHAQAGQLQEARSKFERALLVRPTEPDAMRALASVFLREKMWAEAGKLARKLMVLSPSAASSYLLMSAAHIGSDCLDDADQVLAQALGMLPDEPSLLMEQARVYSLMQRFAESEAAALRVQELDPASLAPRQFIADLDLHQGRIARAFDGLSEILAISLASAPDAVLSAQTAPGMPAVFVGSSLLRTLMFARYARRRSNAEVDLYLTCLHPIPWGLLAKRVEGVTDVIGNAGEIPGSVPVKPLTLLASHFGIEPEEALWDGPYLQVDAGQVVQVQDSLAGRPRPWVGIEVNPHLDKAFLQAAIKAIRAVGGTAVILSPDVDAAEVGEPSVWPRIPDLDMFAVWVQALDTMVSNDGLTPAIAGPLGKRAHVLLGADCDLIWGLQPSRSDWYPELVLYRESRTLGWQPALDELGASLALEWREQQ